MKVHLYVLFTFFTFFGHAQNKKALPAQSEESMISKKLDDEERNVDGNPKEKEIHLLRLKSQSEALNYNLGVLRCGSKLMRLYSTQGRYGEIIKLGDEMKKRITDKSNPKGIISTIYRMNGSALGYLGLDEAGQKDFRTAIKYAEVIENRDHRLYELSLCYLNMNIYFAKKQFEDEKYRDSTVHILNKSQELAKQIRDNNGVVSNSLKYSHIAFVDMRLGIHYLQYTNIPGNLERAEKYLLEGAKIYEDKQYDSNPSDKIMMLNQLSWLYMEKKDYQSSIDHAKRALELDKKYKNPFNRVESYEFLASSYLETGEKEKSKFYMGKYTFLKDSLNLVDKKNADVSMKEMVSEVDSEHKIISQRLWMLISILVVGIIILGIFWRKRNKGIRYNYEQVIERLKQDSLGKPDKLSTSRPKNDISDQTEKELLLKLEAFENSRRFIKADLTIGHLSVKFDTNPRYLSEIIKEHRSNNFNGYINSLRINYIIHKLYNEPKYRSYKVSYLAEQCGFASSQVFNLAFRKVTSVTPSYFIRNLKNENDLPEN